MADRAIKDSWRKNKELSFGHGLLSVETSYAINRRPELSVLPLRLGC